MNLSRSFAAAVVSFAVLSCSATSGSAQAGIPYPTPGTQNPVTYSFIVPATGNVIAYYGGLRGGYTNVLGLEVNGVDTGITGLNSQTSSQGDSLDFGSFLAGSVLNFYINVLSTGDKFYTDTSRNADGVNHVYAVTFTGGPVNGGSYNFPAGTYVAFEDLKTGGDFNYQDLDFVFTNAKAVGVAAPGPIAGAGLPVLIGVAGLWFARRRKQGYAA